MGAVYSPDGLTYDLQALVNSYADDGLLLHLYQNNLDPDRNTSLGDYVECDFNGYAAQTVGSWGAPAFNGGTHTAESVTDATFTFTRTAGVRDNDVYGYYVTNTAGDILLFGERDPGGPYTMAFDGATYIVTLQKTMRSVNP